ncbi:VapE domain-containing protein [Cyanobium sp. ATX-6F1]|uniref:VapE domain-containing protein n=1 Tax=Cyanobium sp. ATX-6F1 TaxID=3137388 RepID=UPI0039BE72EA
MRHLARLAVLAGFNRDAVRQLVAGAAKGIGFPVDSARRIVTVEQHKQAPPPKPLPADAPPEAQLVTCAGAVPEWSANAGSWANALGAGVGDRLRMNLLSSRIEFDGRDLRADTEELLYVCAQQATWKVNKVDCFDGTRQVARAHSFHPVREYLERVAADPTLPTIDLDAIAARYLSVDDSLSAAMIRCKLIEAVARIYEPGCPSVGVVVLRGAQGIGKTEFWQALAGAFYVTSRDTDNGKDQAMSMHRAWFYDFDELDKMTTAKQAASVRSTVSTNCDTFRPPYARREETFPRQFVMVAAVNGDGFLTDKEGNRRFLVIDCPHRKDSGAFIDGPGAKRDRDAIWKAAVEAYRDGAPWRLTPAEQAASNVRNSNWEAVDEWEPALASWAQTSRTPGGFDTREAIVGANLRLLESITRADEMRASDALKRAGFVRRKHEVHRPGKPKARVWLPGGGDMDRHSQPGGPSLAQPAQPWRNFFEEVAPAETHSSASDLPPLTQPTQPFWITSRKKDIRGHP